MTNHNGADRATRRLRWIARIWSIVLIAIALLFVVGYVSSWLTTGVADPHAVEDYPPIENVPPILLLVSVVGLGLAWRWEAIGGAIAVVCSLVNLPILLIHWPIAEDFPRFAMAPYGTWLVVLIPGVLFLICWRRFRRSASIG